MTFPICSDISKQISRAEQIGEGHFYLAALGVTCRSRHEVFRDAIVAGSQISHRTDDWHRRDQEHHSAAARRLCRARVQSLLRNERATAPGRAAARHAARHRDARFGRAGDGRLHRGYHARGAGFRLVCAGRLRLAPETRKAAGASHFCFWKTRYLGFSRVSEIGGAE